MDSSNDQLYCKICFEYMVLVKMCKKLLKVVKILKAIAGSSVCGFENFVLTWKQ